MGPRFGIAVAKHESVEHRKNEAEMKIRYAHFFIQTGSILKFKTYECKINISLTSTSFYRPLLLLYRTEKCGERYSKSFSPYYHHSFMTV